MDWIPLDDISQLETIREKSFETPQIIFKHSTRCSISKMILNRLEKSTPPTGADLYFLDLIKYRNISNQIATDYGVEHESPQVIVIKDGKAIYDASHSAVHMEDIAAQV